MRVVSRRSGEVDERPDETVEFDRGQAGASAARERERRKERRETQVREAHPRTAGLRLTLTRAPRRETAFRSGELAVGALLDKRAAKGPLIALHDRRMPRGRGNVDHIAIVPTGVYVIDAKQYSGKVRAEDLGFRGVRLMIAERDRTKLLTSAPSLKYRPRHSLGERRSFPPGPRKAGLGGGCLRCPRWAAAAPPPREGLFAT